MVGSWCLRARLYLIFAQFMFGAIHDIMPLKKLSVTATVSGGQGTFKHKTESWGVGFRQSSKGLTLQSAELGSVLCSVGRERVL